MTLKTPIRDQCRNCGELKDKHAPDGKCLFEPTRYWGYTDEEWGQYLGTLALAEVNADIARDPTYWNVLPEDKKK